MRFPGGGEGKVRKGRTPLFVLTGPTASGKTEVAHLLADQLGWPVLSVDSMMVYRGMDIGTAKPTPMECATYRYRGLNLVDPGERFSTGDWLRRVAGELDDTPFIAVGGTGLYFRGLADGLVEDVTGSDSKPDDRTAAELRAAIRDLDPTALDRLADPENPRRLARALVRLESGLDLPRSWSDDPAVPVPVLEWDPADLSERIARRSRAMLEGGLLEEARSLRDALSGTAAQAIGYAEAFSVLDGDADLESAVERLTIRTRQYAKRQRTWFRNQMRAVSIPRQEGDDPRDVAGNVLAVWQQHGPLWFDRRRYE